MRATRKKGKSRRRLSSTTGQNNNEKSHLQGEYITNLQQQIYFLELELQIMKEKATTGQFAGRTNISKTAPIDTHVNSLRDKYQYMEKKFKKKVKEIEESLVTITNERDILKAQLDRASIKEEEMIQEVNYYQQIEEKLKEKHLEEKMILEKKLDKLEARLETKTKHYTETKNAFQEFKIKTSTTNLEFRDEIAEINRQCEREKKSTHESEEKKKEMEVELVEAKEEVVLKVALIEEMKREESKFKTEINDLTNQYKKCKMDLDLTESHSEKFEKQCLQLQDLNEDLRGQLHVIKQVEMDTRKSEDRWSHKIVNLKSENSTFKTKLEQNEEDIERIKIERLNISEDLARMEECVREKEERLSQLESDGEALIRRNEHLESENFELKKDNSLKVEEFEKHKDVEHKLESELKRAQNAADEIQAKYNNVQKKVNTQIAIENINYEEVSRLSMASQDINSSIRQLLATIQPDKADRQNLGLEE